MSSGGDESDDNLIGVRGKRRRVLRACDHCRRRKVRCGMAHLPYFSMHISCSILQGDGDQMAGVKCSNCTAYRLPCSYLESAKKRESNKAYIESLENRLEKLEAYLQKTNPDADLSKVLDVPPPHTGLRPDFQVGNFRSPFSQADASPPAPTTSPSHLLRFQSEREPDPDDDEDGKPLQIEELSKELRAMNLGKRFFGKSSGMSIIRTTLNMKLEASGDQPLTGSAFVLNKQKLRSEFWMIHPWEQMLDVKDPTHTFPESDLLHSLVDLFFANNNVYLPLLHRPTFEKNLADGLHLRDSAFGGVVLLVCACASRFSEDTRVKVDPQASWHSSGWKWFSQVRLGRKTPLASPCLYDLQGYALACLFLQGTSAPVSSWTLAGIALRVIQDVGAHRRKMYGPRPTVDGELWKRAFWVLFLTDRWMSSTFGRSCALQDEDFDIDYPLECDDEYWTPSDPAQAFKQPSGKPSKISHFVCLLKLGKILGFALRTIYAINKSSLGFVGAHWEQHIVAELDSALNKWLDSVPDHLRWDPAREDDVSFIQSAHLFSMYYTVQITVHRPFIPSPAKPSTLPYPSLSICTNAARACCNIIGVCQKRMPERLWYMLLAPAFSAGIVLLLNVWSSRRLGSPIDIAREMDDIQKCMRLLKSCEGRCRLGGRLWDAFTQLTTVGDIPIQEAMDSRPSCSTLPVTTNRDPENSSASTPSSASSPAQREHHEPGFGTAPPVVPSQSYRATQGKSKIELTNPWPSERQPSPFREGASSSSGNAGNGEPAGAWIHKGGGHGLPTTASSFGFDARSNVDGGGGGRMHSSSGQSNFFQGASGDADTAFMPPYISGLGGEYNLGTLFDGGMSGDGGQGTGKNMGSGLDTPSGLFDGLLQGMPSSFDSEGLRGLGFADSGAGMWTSGYGLDGWDVFLSSMASGEGATASFSAGHGPESSHTGQSSSGNTDGYGYESHSGQHFQQGAT